MEHACLTLVVPVVVVARLTAPVICLVVGVEVASVAVVDRHSALLGHVSRLSASVAKICRTLSFCSFSSLLVVVVSFAFAFVAAPFVLCHILVVLGKDFLVQPVFNYAAFVVVVAALVPVAPVALPFLRFPLPLYLPFFPLPLLRHVAPMSIGASPWLLLPGAIACKLVSVAVAL